MNNNWLVVNIVKFYELRLGRHPFNFCFVNYAYLLYSTWSQQFNFSNPAFGYFGLTWSNYSHSCKEHNNVLFSSFVLVAWWNWISYSQPKKYKILFREQAFWLSFIIIIPLSNEKLKKKSILFAMFPLHLTGLQHLFAYLR